MSYDPDSPHAGWRPKPAMLAGQRATIALLFVGAGCLAVGLGLRLMPGQTPTGSLRGSLVHAGRPVPGAVLMIDGSATEFKAGPFGEFEIVDVPVGCRTLLARSGELRSGYPLVVGPGDNRLGTLPMHRWRPDAVSGDHGDQPTAEALMIIPGTEREGL